jgi:hypothetical protein
MRTVASADRTDVVYFIVAVPPPRNVTQVIHARNERDLSFSLGAGLLVTVSSGRTSGNA